MKELRYFALMDEEGEVVYKGVLTEYCWTYGGRGRDLEFSFKGTPRAVAAVAAKPRTAPGCECGAHKSMGAGPGHPAHSGWCPWSQK